MNETPETPMVEREMTDGPASASSGLLARALARAYNLGYDTAIENHSDYSAGEEPADDNEDEWEQWVERAEELLAQLRTC